MWIFVRFPIKCLNAHTSKYSSKNACAKEIKYFYSNAVKSLNRNITRAGEKCYCNYVIAMEKVLLDLQVNLAKTDCREIGYYFAFSYTEIYIILYRGYSGDVM